MVTVTTPVTPWAHSYEFPFCMATFDMQYLATCHSSISLSLILEAIFLKASLQIIFQILVFHIISSLQNFHP